MPIADEKYIRTGTPVAGTGFTPGEEPFSHSDAFDTIDGECYVQQDLARIVHRPRLPPWLKRRRYPRIQTGLADRLDQQHRPSLRNHSATAALDADMRVGPDTLLHLESASGSGGNKDLVILILTGQRHFLFP